jgi:hypothetical protein
LEEALLLLVRRETDAAKLAFFLYSALSKSKLKE